MNCRPTDIGADDGDFFDLIGRYVVRIFGQYNETGQFFGRNRALEKVAEEKYALWHGDGGVPGSTIS